MKAYWGSGDIANNNNNNNNNNNERTQTVHHPCCPEFCCIHNPVQNDAMSGQTRQRVCKWQWHRVLRVPQ
jgi:hypothetical protein